MAKKKLPQKLYMRWNLDGEPYLDHSEDPNLLSEMDDTVEAGLYELVKKVKIKSKNYHCGGKGFEEIPK